MNRKSIIILATLFLLPFQSASADSISINPIADATLYESSTGTIANGAGFGIFSGRTLQSSALDIRRALLKFDLLPHIPSDMKITNVTLSLHLSKSRLGINNTSLHRALSNWGEGTSDAGGQEGRGTSATTNDATWLHTFFNTQTWTTPGGDFSPTPLATTPVNSIATYNWNSPALTADVQRWYDNPSENFGWFVIGDEATAGSAMRFDSKETANAGFRPSLTIEFEPIPFLFGDFNNDTLINNLDIDILAAAIQSGSNPTDLDITNDNLVDNNDLDFMIQNILNTFYGDANLDGTVNIQDLSVLASRFNQSGGWADGNFNTDTIINIQDLSKMASNFNKSNTPPLVSTTIPEPASLITLLALFAFTRRKRLQSA